MNVGKADVFVADLSSTAGGTEWAQSFPSALGDTSTAAGVAAVPGGVVVAGSFGQSITVRTAGASSKTLTSTTPQTGFAAQLDPTGQMLVWASEITGAPTTTLAGLSADPSGNTAYVGAAGPDILVTELDPTGTLLVQRLIGGMSGSARSGNAVAFHSPNIYVAGSFAGTLDPGTIPALVSDGANDAFLLELCP